ncbi:2-dehydro-3-deoxyphosphooctonate aldolase [Holospora elegans E1]|uniref:2-dehydro-3-deoxyphosphooctonate aldolase n=1 Tax=Holospora elegans E1 TaxID=1427503 RepID=A0A023DXN2_9PROT|nr:2-dehydro-3-deoxyphosphooctonate aldolase [Holospora elegans E1]
MKLKCLNIPAKEICVHPNVTFSNCSPFVLIAGPCLMESRELAFEIAETLMNICKKLNIAFVFKASFEKANRTGIKGRSTLSFKEALDVFSDIRSVYGCPVITDVHEPHQCQPIAEVVNILQIPAFLCRQTELLKAAIKTGAVLNIKKGQFLSPQEMLKVHEKVLALGGSVPLLCERGACFGYNRLVSDMRSLRILASRGNPVIFDATHSVQLPGAGEDTSLGERWFVEPLSRAAIAVGIAGLFIETHPNPDQALSDGPNMVPLEEVQNFLLPLIALDQVTKQWPYQNFSIPPLPG